MPAIHHGTVETYCDYQCRCAPCLNAWRRFCHVTGREVIAVLDALGAMEYGTPCKRCGRPMAPPHEELEPGYVAHNNDGFCVACVNTIRRSPVVRRAILDVVDGIVDDVAVERAAGGDRNMRATLDELRVAAMQLFILEHSEYDVAFVLGMPLAFVRGEYATGGTVAA